MVVVGYDTTSPPTSYHNHHNRNCHHQAHGVMCLHPVLNNTIAQIAVQCTKDSAHQYSVHQHSVHQHSAHQRSNSEHGLASRLGGMAGRQHYTLLMIGCCTSTVILRQWASIHLCSLDTEEAGVCSFHLTSHTLYGCAP